MWSLLISFGLLAIAIVWSIFAAVFNFWQLIQADKHHENIIQSSCFNVIVGLLTWLISIVVLVASKILRNVAINASKAARGDERNRKAFKLVYTRMLAASVCALGGGCSLVMGYAAWTTMNEEEGRVLGVCMNVFDAITAVGFGVIIFTLCGDTEAIHPANVPRNAVHPVARGADQGSQVNPANESIMWRMKFALRPAMPMEG